MLLPVAVLTASTSVSASQAASKLPSKKSASGRFFCARKTALLSAYLYNSFHFIAECFF
jgi:hypothetical protein